MIAKHVLNFECQTMFIVQMTSGQIDLPSGGILFIFPNLFSHMEVILTFEFQCVGRSSLPLHVSNTFYSFEGVSRILHGKISHFPMTFLWILSYFLCLTLWLQQCRSYLQLPWTPSISLKTMSVTCSKQGNLWRASQAPFVMMSLSLNGMTSPLTANISNGKYQTQP